ncbi:MAG: ureidoglycolate lyase [Burkholderiaceae bacterium]|nr:ureidoglycolate lyase [Burkholderiaceae bacterium]
MHLFPSSVAGGVLAPVPLTPQAFLPFGTVLQAPPSPGRAINQGSAERFDLVDDLQLASQGGRAQLALFRAQARRFPLGVQEMECHRLGSQTFVPLGLLRFVIVVAVAGSPPGAADLHAFVANGRQGITLAPGTWHHALLAVDAGDFVVVERAAASVDCDIVRLPAPRQVIWEA